MSTRFMALILLLGVAILSTGASVDGVREAREWQYAADMAYTHRQLLIAHEFYEKLEKAFPYSRHGRYARNGLFKTKARLVRPVRSPASETPGTWCQELLDFLTWP